MAQVPIQTPPPSPHTPKKCLIDPSIKLFPVLKNKKERTLALIPSGQSTPISLKNNLKVQILKVPRFN